MLSKPTVLVLGAGASRFYGYPLGGELTGELIRSLSNAEKHSLGKELIALGWESSVMKQFAEELLLSQHYSVDAFLEDRPEFTELGKLAIAAALLPREHIRAPFDQGGWYKYMFNRLLKSDASRTSPLTILTYNYDRSLDYYLHTACRHRFNFSDEQAIERMKTVEIIHLHGHLGHLPHQKHEGEPYGALLRHDHLKNAAASIRIIHEDMENDPPFLLARDRLSMASTVCFMGTSYHPKNIQRLCPATWVNKVPRIMGTCQGIPHSEQPGIIGLFETKLSISTAWSCENMFEFCDIIS